MNGCGIAVEFWSFRVGIFGGGCNGVRRVPAAGELC